jgi:hypothetical protein
VTSFLGFPSVTSATYISQRSEGAQIGNRILSHISFVTPVNVGKNVPGRGEEGLLPTLLFRSVFISGADHYVIFDPK